ncbi:hypothetical protein [Sulfurisphaera tokodaii]|uniref:Uncharacterized protein n=1 Tax=Sulfurisphaera tokodaii TaxID=111955 RepID=A0A832WSI0_9CREN|nr:hypothetical protein [Sulfurisphaera tokodaii]HII73354.1 hypothetical protein [Sulfurisphaera tokodaii]
MKKDVWREINKSYYGKEEESHYLIKEKIILFFFIYFLRNQIHKNLSRNTLNLSKDIYFMQSSGYWKISSFRIAYKMISNVY